MIACSPRMRNIEAIDGELRVELNGVALPRAVPPTGGGADQGRKEQTRTGFGDLGVSAQPPRPFLSQILRAVGGDRRVDAGGSLRGRDSGVVHGRGGGICGALPVLKAGAHVTGAGGCACGVSDGDTGNLRHLTEKGLVGAALSMGQGKKVE
jgi:hypothetical protein